jgi:hypothetical protein
VHRTPDAVRCNSDLLGTHPVNAATLVTQCVLSLVELSLLPVRLR